MVYTPDIVDRPNQIPLLAYNHTLVPILPQKPPTCPRTPPFWSTSQQGPGTCAPIPARINAFQNSLHVWMCDLVEVITQRDEYDVLKKTRLMITHVCQRLHCSDVVNNNSGVDFEHCVINKSPYGMLLNSNLI